MKHLIVLLALIATGCSPALPGLIGKCFINKERTAYAKISALEETAYTTSTIYTYAEIYRNFIGTRTRQDINMDTESFLKIYPDAVDCDLFDKQISKNEAGTRNEAVLAELGDLERRVRSLEQDQKAHK